ncbi:sensor histidine kinase [Saccharomonospora iraqiensis]|uniref:sensor histidine kinase n=1 Tax=Saccharomonospora iraqiensis TaxID=52698 RepID=UPI00022DF8DA|nr:GAF domain-containing protein [Saccharomonospora iraqiensis]
MAVPPGPSDTGSRRADTGWSVSVSRDTTVPADDVPDGLAVLDPRGHFVRLNRAALALCGGTGADLTGTPGPFPLADECGAGSPGLFDDDTAEQVTTYTPATGGQREFAYRLHPLSDDPRYTVVAFRDVTDERHRQRRVTALARTAAKLASEGTVSATLDALAAEVVQADGLAGVQILTRGESGGRLHVMGSAGFRHPADFFRRLTRVHELGGTLQMLTALRTREPVVIPRRWEALRDDPAWAPLHDYLVELDWDSFVSIPLITRGQSTGVLNAYLAPGQTVNARTMEFLTAMAEQAAIAVDYTALVERERDVARREERQQLARDLHDSVVQQVFSAGMHVKSMEVLAGRGETVPADTVARVSGEVGELTRSALADLRAMVHQRRPSASVAEAGLAEALRAFVDGTAARAGLRCEVGIAPAVDGLDAELSEDVYRIVTEAVHNVVKHADAATVSVDVDVRDGWLAATVTDDGRGYDTPSGADASGGYGIETMRERATRWGGTVTPTSGHGTGTTVRAVLPSTPTASTLELPDPTPEGPTR